MRSLLMISTSRRQKDVWRIYVPTVGWIHRSLFSAQLSQICCQSSEINLLTREKNFRSWKFHRCNRKWKSCLWRENGKELTKIWKMIGVWSVIRQRKSTVTGRLTGLPATSAATATISVVWEQQSCWRRSTNKFARSKFWRVSTLPEPVSSRRLQYVIRNSEANFGVFLVTS